MERLWPGAAGTDPALTAAVIASHIDAPRTPEPPRPWLMVNMVSSLDGAATRGGRSGAIAGAGDRAVFHALRAQADAILVGAATVRAERYHTPASAPDGHRPRLVIVSGSLDLPLDLPCLSDTTPDTRPLVLTGDSSSPDARARLADVAEIEVVGDDTVDPRAALAALADRMVGVVLCEGGPRLLGQFVGEDLVDEWFLTLGAVAVAGDARRIALGDIAVDQRYRLRSVLHDGNDLFLAYERATSSEGIRSS